MDIFFDKEFDVKSYSPLTLAYVGDAVYELFVRVSAVSEGNRPAGELHKQSVKRVNASAQSQAAQLLMPILDEDEIRALMRGRNASSASIPKNASARDYRYATGLEALFGYLYLSGRSDRLKFIFNFINEQNNGKAR